MREKMKLPKGWEVKKLGEIFTIERGGSPRPIEEYMTDDDDGINWIKIGDTKNVVKYILHTREKIKPEGLKKSRMVYEDDFILSNSMSFGKPFIMKTTGCIHDGWLVIRKSEIIDNNYLYYILSSSLVYQQFSNLAKGSTVKNLNIEAVKQVVISFPPLAEQTTIISKIEELLSDLENGKQQLLTAQAQLKVYRQSLLKWAFEGKLTNKKVKEGELPKGWTKSNLGELKHFSLYGPRFSSDDYSGDGNVAILRTTDISENGKVNWIKAPKLNLSDKDYEKYKLLKDDLLITRTGSIGTISIFNDDKKAIAGAFLIYYRLKETINIKYIFYFLKSHKAQTHFKKASAGVGRPNLNVPNIELLSIPLPPLSEQTRIVEELESKLTICDKIEETISQSLLQAETLRQSILKKAFEGRLV